MISPFPSDRIGPGLTAVVAVALLAGACGDDSSDATAAVFAPEGATFCSVFLGEYRDAVESSVPGTDDGHEEAVANIAAWAEVLRDLAPAEIGDLAQDNLSMHEAQRDRVSAADFISGSNQMHAWAFSNC